MLCRSVFVLYEVLLGSQSTSLNVYLDHTVLSRMYWVISPSPSPSPLLLSFPFPFWASSVTPNPAAMRPNTTTGREGFSWNVAICFWRVFGAVFLSMQTYFCFFWDVFSSFLGRSAYWGGAQWSRFFPWRDRPPSVLAWTAWRVFWRGLSPGTGCWGGGGDYLYSC